jgi:hypothetical protein
MASTALKLLMKIGYARVSTEEQNLDLQVPTLNAAGCDAVFHDHGVSGAEVSRPGLDAVLQQAGINVVLAHVRPGIACFSMLAVKRLGKLQPFAIMGRIVNFRYPGGLKRLPALQERGELNFDYFGN